MSAAAAPRRGALACPRCGDRDRLALVQTVISHVQLVGIEVGGDAPPEIVCRGWSDVQHETGVTRALMCGGCGWESRQLADPHELDDVADEIARGAER